MFMSSIGRCVTSSLSLLLLEYGASTNIGDFIGESPLMLAQEYWRTPVISEMLKYKYGTYLDFVNSKGETALFLAVSTNKIAYATTYLLKGADANRADNRGVTPCQLAVEAGLVGMTQLLGQSGAECPAGAG
jgi:ankyrin repeat protein